MKRSNIIKFRLTCQFFKDFYTKLCVCCTNKRYKTYQMRFSFCHPGHAPGVGLWGAQGGQFFIFQTRSCGISNRPRWWAEQNACKIFILGSNWWPWGEVFGYHVIFNFLYQTLRVFSQIKDRKHIEQNFHSVAGIMPQGCDLGVLGGQKLKRGNLWWRPIDCAF